MGTKVQKKSLTLANTILIFNKCAIFFILFHRKKDNSHLKSNNFYVKKKNNPHNIWYFH